MNRFEQLQVLKCFFPHRSKTQTARDANVREVFVYQSKQQKWHRKEHSESLRSLSTSRTTATGVWPPSAAAHTHAYHQQQQTPRRTPRAPKAPLLSWVHEEPASNASDMLVFCPQALS